MKFGASRRRSHQLIVELTPMIDVVFLLIIFFLTTAQFAQMTRAEVDLPLEAGEQQDTPEEAGLVINIDRQGRIIVADQEVEFFDTSAITATSFGTLVLDFLEGGGALTVEYSAFGLFSVAMNAVCVTPLGERAGPWGGL